MAVGDIKRWVVACEIGKGRLTEWTTYGVRRLPGDDPFRPPPFGDDPADDKKGGKRNDINGLHDALDTVASYMKMGLLQTYADGLADFLDPGIGFLFGGGQQLCNNREGSVGF